MSNTDKPRGFLMQQTYATLHAVTNKIQVNADNYLDFMTSRQLMAMIAIMHLPGGKGFAKATLNNVAKKIGTTKQSAKHIVTSLEKKGYITIEPDSEDKRTINIVITNLGNEALLQSGKKGMSFFDDLFSNFTNEELCTLWTFLRKLYSYDGKAQDGFEEEMHLADKSKNIT